jgi:hypothetical protein
MGGSRLNRLHADGTDVTDSLVGQEYLYPTTIGIAWEDQHGLILCDAFRVSIAKIGVEIHV